MSFRRSLHRSPVSWLFIASVASAASLGAGACSSDEATPSTEGEAGADGAGAGFGGASSDDGVGGAPAGRAGGGSGGKKHGGAGEGASGSGRVGEGGADGASAGAGGEGGESELPDDGADDDSSARYRLKHKESGLCVRHSDAPTVEMTNCDESDASQEFFLDPGKRGVRVRSAADPKECLHLSSDAVLWRACARTGELTMVNRPNGGVELKGEGSKCLMFHTKKKELGPGECDASADWEPESAGLNFALAAAFEATSTYSGYSVDYVHDGNVELGLEGQSWTNAWDTPDLPATISIDLGQKRQFSRIDVYTSTGYEIAAFDLDWFDGDDWHSIATVTENTEEHLVFLFSPVVTQHLRVVARKGPTKQPNFARLNEVMIH